MNIVIAWIIRENLTLTRWWLGAVSRAVGMGHVWCNSIEAELRYAEQGRE